MTDSSMLRGPVCDACGRFNRPAAQFCAGCGSATSDPPTDAGGPLAAPVAPSQPPAVDPQAAKAMVDDESTQPPPPPPPPAEAAVLAASAAAFRHVGPAAHSAAGRKPGQAQLNEDAVFALGGVMLVSGEGVPVTLFALADGLSGEEAGHVASQAAVAFVAERLLRGLVVPLLAGDSLPLPETVRQHVRDAIVMANVEVRDLCRSRMVRSSSTLSAGVLVGGRLTLGHVGDCRVYCRGADGLQALTNDHTVAAEGMAAGAPALNENGLEARWVTRAIGREPFVQVDIVEHGMLAGDMIIACTDGVWRALGDDAISALVAPGLAPFDATTALVAHAQAVDDPDDCTAVCLAVVGAPSGGQTTTIHPPPMRAVDAVAATGSRPAWSDVAARQSALQPPP